MSCAQNEQCVILDDSGVLWRCRGTVQEVDEILTKARMFQFKPDGDVTFMTFQDAQGKPITTFQDPLHYPHNTKFLAPGETSYSHAAWLPAPILRRLLAKDA